MSSLNPEAITGLMFLMLAVGIGLGYPLAYVLAATGLFFGIGLFGFDFSGAFMLSFLSVMKNFVLLAIPLFVFMGAIMERSGISDRLFSNIYALLGKLKGGLGVATIILATIFAACTGVVGASVVTVGLLALPTMLKRGYDKKLASGIICSGGCLGVLIPPSIMIVIYGPTAGIPVGKLFMSVMVPGLLLSAGYSIYTLIKCNLNPKAGPPMPDEELKQIRANTTVPKIILSALPPVVIILSVLGAIFFGIASPTEAAAMGCGAAVLLALFYKKLSLKMLAEACDATLRTTSTILLMTVGASFFVSAFMSSGGGQVVQDLILGLPFGKWGVFGLMTVVTIILGMFLDWTGIVYLTVPIFTPIAKSLGFDTIWFATMMILLLQFSYLTPPFALSAFYFKGIAGKDYTINEIYSSLYPFIIIQLLVFAIITLLPGIVTWLPNQMSTGWL